MSLFSFKPLFIGVTDWNEVGCFMHESLGIMVACGEMWNVECICAEAAFRRTSRSRYIIQCSVNY